MKKGGLAMVLAAGMAAGSPPNGAVAQPVQPLPRHTGPVALDAPSVTIGNGVLTAKIYRVDARKGFYRGTRFDQAGVVGSLTISNSKGIGHDFYGPWFDRVSNEVHDFMFTPEGIVGGLDSAVSGPVEEFAPIGFDAAAAGGTFVKIGVGVLKKPDDAPYDHYRIYDIVDAGKRGFKSDKTSATFTQDIPGQYLYVKTLVLAGNQMRIEHELTNRMAAPIATTVYDHNFAKLSPGNADVAVTFPFAATANPAPDPALAKMDGSRFTHTRALKDAERVSTSFTGFGTGARDYDITAENVRTGAAVRVTADHLLVKVNYFSVRSIMAVEPYIAINLAPGQSMRWTYTYTYTAPR